MSFIDIQALLEMREHLSIVHHVPGRVRLRVGAALYGQASALDGNSLNSFLQSMDGIHDIRVNPAAASLVVRYDPTHYPPNLWETLVAGDDRDASQLFSELIASHEHYLEQSGARL